MLTALYYPHIKLANKDLVKSSLLLWDRIEVIDPFRDPEAPWHSDDDDMRDALNLVARRYAPTPEVKAIAHDAVLELATSNLPDWFFFENHHPDLQYRIYPQKFLEETWQALEELNLVYQTHDGRSWTMADGLGLKMMAILADCSAGTQKRPVTDEVDAYASHDAYLQLIGGGRKAEPNEELQRLVSISVEVVDPKRIKLRNLVDLRQREAADGTGQLRDMRHGYLNRIENTVDKIKTEARHQGDIDEIERAFKQDMEDDLGALREELKLKAKDLIFSKEMVVAVVSLAGALFQPVAGLPTAAFGLARGLRKYEAERNKSLKKHTMSWLYGTKKIPVY